MGEMLCLKMMQIKLPRCHTFLKAEKFLGAQFFASCKMMGFASWLYQGICAGLSSFVIAKTMTDETPIYFKNHKNEYKELKCKETMCTYTMISYSLMAMYFVLSFLGFWCSALFSLSLCSSVFVTSTCTFILIPRCRDDEVAMRTMLSPLSQMTHNINCIMMLCELVNRQEFFPTIPHHIGLSLFYLVFYATLQYQKDLQLYQFLNMYSPYSILYIGFFVFFIIFIHAFMTYFSNLLFALPYRLQYMMAIGLGGSLGTWY